MTMALINLRLGRVFSVIAALLFGIAFLYMVSMNKASRDMAENGYGEPLLKFGVFSDVQYADIDNKMNFEQTRMRYYRDSKYKVKRLMHKWNNEEPVKFVLNLGDLIDGQARRKAKSEDCLKELIKCFKEFSGNIYHVLGNHDFYNFKRDRLMMNHDLNSAYAIRRGVISPEGTANAPEDKGYYSFVAHPKLRIIMMDHFEFSALGRDKDDQVYVRALAFLTSRNKNDDLNSSDGLHGFDTRFAKYNGGPSAEQLLWLESQIQEAANDKQYVIVAGHAPANIEATVPHCLLWNYQAVLEVLKPYKNVIAYLAGHDHRGGYAVDANGVHHLTINGLVEADPGTLDCATFNLYEDKLVVQGSGQVLSFQIELPVL